MKISASLRQRTNVGLKVSNKIRKIKPKVCMLKEYNASIEYISNDFHNVSQKKKHQIRAGQLLEGSTYETAIHEVVLVNVML